MTAPQHRPHIADRVQRLESWAFATSGDVADIKTAVEQLPSTIRQEILGYMSPVLGEIMADGATLATREDVEQLKQEMTARFASVDASGHNDLAPRAMVNLGVLESELGDVVEARRWWHEAIASGQADHMSGAMVNLRTLEETQGNVNEARPGSARRLPPATPIRHNEPQHAFGPSTAARKKCSRRPGTPSTGGRRTPTLR